MNKPEQSIIDWLLDSDPAIRWQVMRDLTDAPEEEIAQERARIANEGIGAKILALQGLDGTWSGAAWILVLTPPCMRSFCCVN